jgi:carbon-monoxide dehydrogenase medium subunit
LALDARITYRAGGNDSDISARDFFIGLMTTALPAGACLTGVRFPVWRGKVGIGFHEVNARRSDFAFVAAAAQVELADDGKCKRIAIAVGAATDIPIRLNSAETQLTSTTLDEHKIKDAVRAALHDMEPLDDLHASAAYRRRVAATLVERAIADARAGAREKLHAH